MKNIYADDYWCTLQEHDYGIMLVQKGGGGGRRGITGSFYSNVHRYVYILFLHVLYEICMYIPLY